MLMDAEKKEFLDVHWIFINLCHLTMPSVTEERAALFDLAGSYAQLTLLGQPKASPILHTQKSVSTESQNGRVQFRTQISTPERSISAIHTIATPLVFDAKKARDAYEKIFKQFEVRVDSFALSVSPDLVFSSSWPRKNLIANERKVRAIIPPGQFNWKANYDSTNNN